ncbi:tubby C-terminal-like domain-containing protein [Gorgonomyces haynaldii]|nr:tubby C-terminal-like domain-containing protein [Gorgonomyces haynaldii]
MEKVMLLKNKPPRWNEATQSHCLNFGGRVTQPSIKNMQLIAETDFDATILLQFGRCGPDFFTLDVRWPLTPFEAFCIAITTFEADDSN